MPFHRSTFLKSCPGIDVNTSVAYFEKHPELWFDGKNSKRAVVSAFENPDSRLKSLCFDVRKQEWCDGVNDVAGEIEDVEEIADQMTQIQPQIVECLCLSDGAGSSARGGLTSQADDEPVEKQGTEILPRPLTLRCTTRA